MAKKNTISMRVDADFKEWIEQIAAKRKLSGKDKKIHKPARMSKAIMRIPNIDKYLEEWDIR